jgi:hypothetical protein
MSWSDRFSVLFAEIARPLAVVLNADGCREGWLQGEFYRHFRPQYDGFRVNYSYGSGRVKHDLYCPVPNEMVAELKVYGMRGYLNKNLCGQSNIKRFLPATAGTRVNLSREEIDRLGASGYLADVCRLQRLPDSLERYMILVLQKADDPDDFGQAIAAVQVSWNERQWESHDFLVRISPIQ